MPALVVDVVSTDSQVAKARFWYQTEDDDAFIEEYTRNVQSGRPVNNYFAVESSIVFFGLGRLEEARQVLVELAKTQTTHDSLRQVSSAYIEIESARSHRERLQVAREYSAELRTRIDQSSGVYLHFDWTVLRLLGCDDEQLLHKLATRFREANLALPDMEAYVPIADYMLGKISKEQLISACSVRRGVLVEALFILAFDELARGNRPQAKQAFEALVETKYHDNLAHHWSRAIIRRMQAEEDWPDQNLE